MYAVFSEWQDMRWQMVLMRRQNIAPERKAKSGHRVIGSGPGGVVFGVWKKNLLIVKMIYFISYPSFTHFKWLKI